MSLTIWQVDAAYLTPYYDAVLCEELARSGADVQFFTSHNLYDTALPSPNDYQRHELYFRALNQRWLIEFPRLRRSLRSLVYLVGHRALLERATAQRPDIVHFQWFNVPPLDLWLVEKLKQLGIPVFHTIHDHTPLFRYMTPSVLQKIYLSMDRLFVHTEMSRETLPTSLQQKLRVIAHPAIRFSMPLGANRDAARTQLGIPLDARLCLFFGTIRPYKGIDILLEAFAAVKQRCPNLHLLVAGHSRDKQLRKNLNALPDVHTQLDYIPSDRVWRYHRAADWAVFPYRRISQSGALITAMGFGLPVIVSNIGGLSETVHENGWIVPSEDVRALSHVLETAYYSPTQLEAMGYHSRNLIARRHDAVHIARQVCQVYEEVRSCSAYSTVPTA